MPAHDPAQTNGYNTRPMVTMCPQGSGHLAMFVSRLTRVLGKYETYKLLSF